MQPWFIVPFVEINRAGRRHETTALDKIGYVEDIEGMQQVAEQNGAGTVSGQVNFQVGILQCLGKGLSWISMTKPAVLSF